MPQLNAREAVAVAFPVFAMFLVAVRWSFVSESKPDCKTCSTVGVAFRFVASSALLGLAFLPLSIIYRPNLIEIAKPRSASRRTSTRTKMAIRSLPSNISFANCDAFAEANMWKSCPSSQVSRGRAPDVLHQLPT